MSDMEEPIFEGEEEDEAEEVLLHERTIVCETQAPSWDDLNRRFRRGKLQLRPGFQRRIVWDFKKMSKFIESILLDVPLPYVYLAEEEDGTKVVVDGQQRLNAVFSFLDGSFRLQSCSIMSELNEKAFMDLDGQLQSKIEEKCPPIVLIKKESDSKMKFDVFERLNTGAVQLNAQELRNCINRGPFNDLINELSTYLPFRALLAFDRDRPHPRMKDNELVLRFFAFCDFTTDNYKKPMKRFLDKEMERRKTLTEQEARNLTRQFRQTIDLVNTVFADNAFRRYEVTDDEEGRWHSTPNVALYDVIMYSFAKNLGRRPSIVKTADAIREGLIILLSKDEDFIDSLEKHTSDEDRVKLRFKKWLDELGEVLKNASSREPRLFSLALKRELFEDDPTCQLCSQRIHDPDNAELDHVEHYWRGGRTIPENARLVHRYCNRARGGRS